MTRRSRREIERMLEDLEPDEPAGERPPEFSAEEKAALDELFATADPEADDPTPASRAVEHLHERQEGEL